MPDVRDERGHEQPPGGGSEARRALARALESITLSPAEGALVESDLFAVEIVSAPCRDAGGRTCDLDIRVLPHALDREVPEEVLAGARQAFEEHLACPDPALRALAGEELRTLERPAFDRGALAGLTILLWSAVEGEARLVASALTDRHGHARFADIPAELGYHLHLAGQAVETVPLRTPSTGRDDLAAHRAGGAEPLLLGASRDERVRCYWTPPHRMDSRATIRFRLEAEPLRGGIQLAIRRRGEATSAETAFLPLRDVENGVYTTEPYPLPPELDLGEGHAIDFELVARAGRGAPTLEDLASLLAGVAFAADTSALWSGDGWEVEVEARAGRSAGCFDACIRALAERAAESEGASGLWLLVWSGNTTWLPTDPTDERGEVRFRRLPEGGYGVRLMAKGAARLERERAPSARWGLAESPREAPATPAAVLTRGAVRVRGGASREDARSGEPPPATEGEERVFHLPDRRLVARLSPGDGGSAILTVETGSAELEGAGVRYTVGGETGTVELRSSDREGTWSGQVFLEISFAQCGELVPTFEVLPPGTQPR